MSPKIRSALQPSPVTQHGRPRIVRLLESQDSTQHVEAFARAVCTGLAGEPKTLPWGYFYDETGSRLFDAICELPEYYLTRTEDAILCRHASAMIDGLAAEGEPESVIEPTMIELGSGSALKTQRLIAAVLRRQAWLHYVPIDVSATALEESTRRLTRQFPLLKVTGYVADYRSGLERIMSRARGPRMIVFLGSSLGNYDEDATVELLGMIRQTMRPDDTLLLGTDLAKERSVLEAAYDDARGVTAAFNLNLLRRINRELGADFPVDAFEHRAIYQADRGRVEMHLVSTREQTVTIAAARTAFHFATGESVHTESSHKYTLEMLSHLRSKAGFVEDAAWTDVRGWFRLQRWRPDSVAGNATSGGAE